MDAAGRLVRELRARHALGQRELAARAGTTQTQISRIERGVVSPSLSTLERIVAAVGERLELSTVRAPRQGTREFLPVHRLDRRRDVETTTAAERVAQAIALSRTATRIAAAGRPAP